MGEAYVVELETGTYLAEWDGDPGRTLDIKHAARFTEEIEAQYAIMQAKGYRTFEGAKVVPVLK